MSKKFLFGKIFLTVATVNGQWSIDDHCCPDKIKGAEDDWVEFVNNKLKALGKPLRCASGRALRSNLLATLGGFPLRSLLHRIIEKHASELCFRLKLAMNKVFISI